MNARLVAFRCLQRIDHEGAYANIVLSAELGRSKLVERDRKFVTELVYGTTRMRRACDALVDRFVSSTPSPEVRTVLRLGAYQLHFAGVPAHAAVGETVELAPKRARGFVNAVLRRVANTPMVWPSEAVRLSYPDWIFERLVAELGHDDAIATLTTMNEAPPVSERDDGYIQDLGSQWVAAAVPAREGDLVLDVCAAPGGKATGIATTGATVVAADLQPQRVGLIVENADRLGTRDVVALVADATRPPFAGASFDHVLIDAPCSGLGTLRRRADARWRITPGDVNDLVALQQRILGVRAAGETRGFARLQRLHPAERRVDRPHDALRVHTDHRSARRGVARLPRRLARAAPRRRHRRHDPAPVPPHRLSAQRSGGGAGHHERAGAGVDPHPAAAVEDRLVEDSPQVRSLRIVGQLPWRERRGVGQQIVDAGDHERIDERVPHDRTEDAAKHRLRRVDAEHLVESLFERAGRLGDRGIELVHVPRRVGGDERAPPGRRTRRNSRRAAAGSGTWYSMWLATTRSNESSSKGNDCASHVAPLGAA